MDKDEKWMCEKCLSWSYNKFEPPPDERIPDLSGDRLTCEEMIVKRILDS